MSQLWFGMSGIDWALIGAASASILAGCGSAWGITVAASTVSGIVAEDSEKFGKLLPIVAIPGTQGIYGFISAVLVLIFFRILGGANMAIPGLVGFKVFLACQPVAWLCFVSAYYQGKTSAAAAGIVARRDEDAGKALILPALVETYAVLSLIVTILMLTSLSAAYMR